MKIVITGVNGFVGGCLANYFSTKNYEITGIGRQPELAAFVNKKCEYIYADITKPLKIFKTDVVIHAAAITEYWPSRSSKIREVNIEGTRNVINAVFVNKIKKCSTVDKSARSFIHRQFIGLFRIFWQGIRHCNLPETAC